MDPLLQGGNLSIFNVPKDATNGLYIDGIPNDATEREVAHIFRPFPGFIDVRLIKKQAPSGRVYYYCFIDFKNPLQATIALNTLQGYRFHKNDSTGLKISFAVDKKRRDRSRSRSYGRR